jgi:hypothetical protein
MLTFETADAPPLGLYNFIQKKLNFGVLAKYFDLGNGVFGNWDNGVHKEHTLGPVTLPCYDQGFPLVFSPWSVKSGVVVGGVFLEETPRR